MISIYLAHYIANTKRNQLYVEKKNIDKINIRSDNIHVRRWCCYRFIGNLNASGTFLFPGLEC